MKTATMNTKHHHIVANNHRRDMFRDHDAHQCGHELLQEIHQNDDVLLDFNTKNNPRRNYLKSICGFAISLSTTSFDNIQPSHAAQTTGEAIRRSAANIPGYGQADVYYPHSFIGKWKATRVIVSSDDPILSSIFSVDQFPLAISYDVRFVTVDGDDGINMSDVDRARQGGGGGNGSKVVADRQYNEKSYYDGLRDVIENRSEKMISLPLIQSTSWSPSNPNVLTTIYNDGSSKEVKVTKRATEMDELNGVVSSSEYRRITRVATSSGVPTITASRILNKWKVSDDGVIEGIEIVYSDGAIGDPLMAVAGNQQQQQQLSSKSRIRLER